jgi:hypothetical protein
MKRLFQLLALSFLALSSQAQTTTATKTVTKTVSGNALTEDLTVPSGKTLTVATGGTATAPAWFLNTFTASTISTGQNGLGWDENGRVTLQTPVGALQFYATGSPSESVIYWPGRIITNAIDAGAITGNLPADRINAPLGSETFNDAILRRSLAPPLDKWQMGQTYAGTAGITYVVDTDMGNSEYEPTVGVYFPQANVTSGGLSNLNQLAGRYRTATQVKADLAITTADVSGALSAATAASTYATNASLTDASRSLTVDSVDASAGVVSAALFVGDGSNITGLSASEITSGTISTANMPSQTTATVTTSGGNMTILPTAAICIFTGATASTWTLPSIAVNGSRAQQLEIINKSTANLTLARNGSDLIEGDTTAIVPPGHRWSLTSDTVSNWILY